MFVGRRQLVCILTFVLALHVGLSDTCFGGFGSSGTGTGVGVRNRVRIKNDTGQNATDLHVQAYQKEQGVSVNGGSISCGEFSNVGTGLSQGSFHNDGEDHQLDGDLTGGNVAGDDWALLDITLWLTKRNQMWLRFEWTHDDVGQGENGPVGVDVGDPQQGGGGGAGGAQEGDGGDINHIHPITIYNDTSKEMILKDVYLFASMTRYDDLGDLSWATVPKVLEETTIAAGETWEHDFETTGRYGNGHVYMNATIIDGEIQIIFDHPVPPVPEPTAVVLLAMGAVGGLVRRRRR